MIFFCTFGYNFIGLFEAFFPCVFLYPFGVLEMKFYFIKKYMNNSDRASSPSIATCKTSTSFGGAKSSSIALIDN